MWLDFGIDKDAKAGIYNGKVTISADNTDVEQIIDYSIEVIDADFLDENEYSFRPDFWTYPFSSGPIGRCPSGLYEYHPALPINAFTSFI